VTTDFLQTRQRWALTCLTRSMRNVPGGNEKAEGERADEPEIGPSHGGIPEKARKNRKREGIWAGM
jgi:hypothetical protein